MLTTKLNTAQALRVWHEVFLTLVSSGRCDLSQRQMAILLVVYLDPPPHTVRGLASRLGVTKPVITRALDTMGKQGLVSRRRDENDKRNVLIQRTVTGSQYLELLAELTLEEVERIIG